MSNDPYRPPSAPIDEARPEPERAPVSVRNACALILVALVLGFATFIPGIAAPAPRMTAGLFVFETVFVAFFSALTYWLTIRIRQRSNRARVALLVLLASGWLLLAGSWQEEIAQAPIAALIDLGVTAIEVVAAWLLVSGDGAKWFARPHR